MELGLGLGLGSGRRLRIRVGLGLGLGSGHLANAAVVLEVDLRGDLALGMLRLGLELGVGMTAFR